MKFRVCQRGYIVFRWVFDSLIFQLFLCVLTCICMLWNFYYSLIYVLVSFLVCSIYSHVICDIPLSLFIWVCAFRSLTHLSAKCVHLNSYRCRLFYHNWDFVYNFVVVKPRHCSKCWGGPWGIAYHSGSPNFL